MKKQLKMQRKHTELEAQILSSKESKALESLIRASENKKKAEALVEKHQQVNVGQPPHIFRLPTQ